MSLCERALRHSEVEDGSLFTEESTPLQRVIVKKDWLIHLPLLQADSGESILPSVLSFPSELFDMVLLQTFVE